MRLVRYNVKQLGFVSVFVQFNLGVSKGIICITTFYYNCNVSVTVMLSYTVVTS